ncbi:ASCH domain-containing protein [Candidatus Hepatobacter penaei]|uniref:ASCH domain-containing protein n=1 Tax=Candidatus Hepatobacter penaei TaxID=1274402 RepID=UPI0006983453|nr:ASCH domain-containing protein [Candidatus Hepatobacter penaei]
MQSRIHTLHLERAYVELIRNKQKTVEGRLNKEKYQTMRPGDILAFCVKKDRSDTTFCKVLGLRLYATFRTMLEAEGLRSCLPTAETLEEGVATYHRFADYQQREKRDGVLAINMVYLGSGRSLEDVLQ